MGRIEELRAVFTDERRTVIERLRAFNEYDSLRFQEILRATSLIDGLPLPETRPTMTSVRMSLANEPDASPVYD